MLVLFMVSSSCYSQITARYNSSKKAVKKVQEHQPELVKVHTERAISQLTQHLRESLAYPKFLQEKSITQFLILAVRINKSGEIEFSKVLGQPLLSFEVETLEAINKFEGLKLQDSLYQGARRIDIPIRFCMK